METAFGWIGQIFGFILNLIPHIQLVNAVHEGVKFKSGRFIIPIKCDNGTWIPYLDFKSRKIPALKWYRSGVHFYFPLVTECQVVPVKRQTTNLVVQNLLTKDSNRVSVSGILVFEVKDSVKLLTECWDYEDTIRDLCLTAIKKVVVSNNLEDLTDVKMDKILTQQMRKELNPYGVAVIKMTLSDVVDCQMIGHIGTAISLDIHPNGV